MNATQTRTGGERQSMGPWIDRWLGGRAKPARGRTRTRATLSVEGLEGRVVMSGVSAVGLPAIQNVASAIVKNAEQYCLQQPQKLPAVISSIETPGELSALLNIVGIQTNVSGENFFLQQGSQYTDFALVEIDVSLDLLTQPTSVPSADVASAFVTSFTNAVTSIKTASNNLGIYNTYQQLSQSSAASLATSLSKSVLQNVELTGSQASTAMKTLAQTSAFTQELAQANTNRSNGMDYVIPTNTVSPTSRTTAQTEQLFGFLI